MADVPGDPLPDPVRQLLGQPPVTQKKLLELRAEWPAPSPAQARMAAALRLFVITWDPLELLGLRPAAFAAVNTDPLELAVYLPCWSLAELAAEQEQTQAAALGAVAGAAVMTASAHRDVVISGRYPDLARRGRVPDLVGDPTAGSALGLADIQGGAPRPRTRRASPWSGDSVRREAGHSASASGRPDSGTALRGHQAQVGGFG